MMITIHITMIVTTYFGNHHPLSSYIDVPGAPSHWAIDWKPGFFLMGEVGLLHYWAELTHEGMNHQVVVNND